MEVDIRVTMGEQTCGECPLRVSTEDAQEICVLLDDDLDFDEDLGEWLRHPACAKKYGTGDQPEIIGRVLPNGKVLSTEPNFTVELPGFGDGGTHRVTSVLINGREINLGKLAAMDAVVEAARRLRRAWDQISCPWYADEVTEAQENFVAALAALDAEGGRG